MKQINLIPWRAQAREQRKREFFNLLAFAVAGSLLFLVFIHVTLSSSLRDQNAINSIYQQEIDKMNQQLMLIGQIKKQQDAINDRINIIDKLQANRSQTVDIFVSLVKTLPQGVYLRAIRRADNEINLIGRAQSNTRISTFMRNLESLPWLQEASLSQIQTDTIPSNYINDFILDLKLKPLQGLDDIDKKADASKDKSAKKN